MAEIVFWRGVSEIQCLMYHQNNVNPFEICKNWIIEHGFSCYNKTPAEAFTPPAEKKIGTALGVFS